MNRLGKKCFIVSIATHGLLILILFVGPAFFAPHDKVVDMPLLDVIPSKLIDAQAQGGGDPRATPPSRQVQEPVRQPVQQVRQPVVEPEHHVPVREVTHVRPTPEPLDKAELTPTKHTVEISTKLVKRNTTSTHKKPTPTETSNDDSQAQAKLQERTAFRNAMNSLKDGLSSTTTISMPPGNGGEAYANYAQAIKTIYEEAWIAPDESAADDGTTKVSIVIERDGTVYSAHVIRSSGNSSVDNSVERALARVKTVPPFPEGATDSRRTFNISFNLKAKRLSG